MRFWVRAMHTGWLWSCMIAGGGRVWGFLCEGWLRLRFWGGVLGRWGRFRTKVGSAAWRNSWRLRIRSDRRSWSFWQMGRRLRVSSLFQQILGTSMQERLGFELTCWSYERFWLGIVLLDLYSWGEFLSLGSFRNCFCLMVGITWISKLMVYIFLGIHCTAVKCSLVCHISSFLCYNQYLLIHKLAWN